MWKYSSTVVVDLYVFCDCDVFVYSVFVFCDCDVFVYSVFVFYFKMTCFISNCAVTDLGFQKCICMYVYVYESAPRRRRRQCQSRMAFIGDMTCSRAATRHREQLTSGMSQPAASCAVPDTEHKGQPAASCAVPNTES